jgi:lincosamide nucleotidyltransferase A/C/D/E
VDAEQVAELYARLDERGIRAWVGGGWGVDALVGRVTRDHGDLDVAVDAEQLDPFLALLRDLRFVVVTDWLPSRVELAAADGRRVDVHPVEFDDEGSGLQAGHGGPPFRYPADAFTEGVIGRARVPCITATQQLQFRTGYPLRDRDRHDIPLLLALLPADAATRWTYDEDGRLVAPRGARPGAARILNPEQPSGTGTWGGPQP